MNRYRVLILLAMVVVLAVAPSFSAAAQDDDGARSSWSVPGTVVAPILDVDGNQIGLVALGEDAGEPGLIVIVDGLSPGEHGIHLHEAGRCESQDDTPFSAAGGHFNPGNMPHPYHAGDLGNLVVGESGASVLFADLGAATFDDGVWGVMDDDGTALIIHATVDDLDTDPSGNSGARIACAVLAPNS